MSHRALCAVAYAVFWPAALGLHPLQASESPTLNVSEDGHRLDGPSTPDTGIKDVFTAVGADGTVAVAWTHEADLEAAAAVRRLSPLQRVITVGAAILTFDSDMRTAVYPDLLTIGESAPGPTVCGIGQLQSRWWLGWRTDGGSVSVAQIAGGRLRDSLTVSSRMHAGFLRMISNGESLHFFWSESFHERLDLPDIFGGRDRRRVRHVRFHDGDPGQPQTIFENGRYDFDFQEHLLQVEPGRFDLLLLRQPSTANLLRSSGSAEIVHVADLTGAAHSQTVTKCSMGATFAAVAWGHDLHLVWADEERTDPGGRRLSTLTRCLAAAQHGSEWSGPTALGQSTSWNASSMAVGVVSSSHGGLLVALWQGRNSRLTHVTSLDGHSWSQPVETTTEIGRRNWLCNTPRGTVLITQDGRHLHARALAIAESQ